MRKALMVVSLTAFVAAAAFAAPRNSDVPAVSSSDSEREVVINSNDQGTVSDFTKPVDEKPQGFRRSAKAKR